MNEPVKNRVTVYEVERFCERLHKLVIESHPSLGEPRFSLETGTLRVSFPEHQVWDLGPDMGPVPIEVFIQPAQAPISEMVNAPPVDRAFQDMEQVAEITHKPRKSKKVPQ